jgi:hypothetical protein
VIVRLNHKHVRVHLGGDLHELGRGIPDRRVHDNVGAPRLRTLPEMVAEPLEFQGRALGIGAGTKARGAGMRNPLWKALVDDVNHVQLCFVDRANEIAGPCQQVFADVAQIDSDDQHDSARFLALGIFVHGDLRSKTGPLGADGSIEHAGLSTSRSSS